MYYIGLDLHKKTISYWIKDANGRIVAESMIAATRAALDGFIDQVPKPWSDAMEATLFTGWVHDLLVVHSEVVKVANPLMLKAISASKKKNDRVDASKIADLLRCDLLPECYMASSAIRERRRTLRYRNLLVRPNTQTKNRMAGLLMETEVSYNKEKLHQKGYFRELMKTSTEVPQPLKPLLRVGRETVERIQKTERSLLKALAKDPELKERVDRLLSIPGIGEITALSWVLEVGEVKRFRSVKHAISYCGLCGAEDSSGGSGETNADLQTAQQAFANGFGGRGQAGSALPLGSGAGLRKRKTERKSQPGHIGGSSQASGLLAGSRSPLTTV